ncbi:unnamed protein product [Closterium sp. NIES-53]
MHLTSLHPRSYAEAIADEYSSKWQTAMDSEMASCKSSGTYINEVPPPGANIVDGMWIFTVKRPPGSPPAFKPSRGDLAAPPTWLHLVVSCGHQVEPSAASLWSLPGEWHDTLRMTLAALGFSPSSADPSLFLRTDTSRLPIYVLVYVLQRFGFQFSSPQHTPLPTGHSLSAPPSDESVQPSGPYPELVVLGGRGSVVLTGHSDVSCADDRATQHSSQGYTFSLGSDSVSWRSTCSSSVLGSSCEAKIFAGGCTGATLPGLEEQPRSPPVFYVDNKAMLALCHEQRLEHRTKHIPRQKTRRGF